MQKLFDLSNRVAIVTGGSRGLGLQIAQALGEYGATPVLVARKQAELDTAVKELEQVGIVAIAAGTDLSAAEASSELVKQVLARFGRIDILVNNAGASWGAPAEDYPADGWNKVIGLNLTGVFALSQAVARHAFLPTGKGVIVNVASTEGLLGHHADRLGTVAYNAAKGGVVNMTRALAAEWGPRNIRVNAIAPGFFPSKMTYETLAAHGDQLIRDTPRGGWAARRISWASHCCSRQMQARTLRAKPSPSTAGATVI